MEFITKQELEQEEIRQMKEREEIIIAIMKKHNCDYSLAEAEYEVGGILPY